MSESFKWNVKEGEEYPIINRILLALVMSICVFCLFWPLTLLLGFLSLMVYLVFPGVVRDLITVAWPLAFLAIAILVFNESKSKPYYGHGTYVPGSAPNPHKYQSSLWYAHEAMMDRERQAERERNRLRD